MQTHSRYSYTSIDQTLENAKAWGVDHIQNRQANRTVGVRLACDKRGFSNGRFNISFSDHRVDLRETGQDTQYNVTAKQARKMIDLFLHGELLTENDYGFWDYVNQADRDLGIIWESETPSRVRVDYEMPNAGMVEAWRGKVRIGEYVYIEKRGQ